MMTTRHSQKTQDAVSGQKRSWTEIGLAVFLVLMFILPFFTIGLIIETEPYYSVPKDPLSNAAKAAGITVTTTKDVNWKVPGATGGKTYTLSDSAGNSVTISTQAFDSAESRDAAVQQYNAVSVGKGRPAGDLVVVGQYLVYVTPANSPVLKEVATMLKSSGKADKT